MPARVTFAPLKVAAVVDPDLISKLLELLVNVPYCVPPSFKITSAPSASRTMSVGESIVISPVAPVIVLVDIPVSTRFGFVPSSAVA